jgi:hypothetical protein
VSPTIDLLPHIRQGGGPINAKDPRFGPGAIYAHGAIADGNTHPLSAFFSSLAAAKAVYPAAAALTDELDWAATQKAVDHAATSGRGCQVYVPRGQYQMNRSLLMKASSSPVQGVGLRGDGYDATRFKMTVDLGPDQWAIRADPSIESVGNNQALFESFRVVGPNQAFNYGVKPCDMEGIKVAGNWNFKNVAATFFLAGIRLFKDHNNFEGCQFVTNYFNVRIKGAQTTGDLQFIACTLSAAAFASISIGQSPQVLAGFQMYGGHLGFAPYAVYVETGTVTSTADSVAISMMFDRTSFEACGNGIFYDEDCIGGFQNISFRDTGPFNLTDTYKIASRGRQALFRIGGMATWRWQNVNTIGTLADAVFWVGGWGYASSSNVFDGDLAAMFGSYKNAGKPIFTGPAGIADSYVKGTYEGQIMRANSAISAGRVCEWIQGQARHAGASGANKSDLAGVAWQDTPAATWGIFLKRGQKVAVFCTETPAADEKACLDPSDPSKVARHLSHTAELVVGCVYAGVFNAAPGLATLYLDLPQHRA